MNRIEKLTQFMQAEPADPFLQHALGIEYVAIQDDKKAQFWFEKVIAGFPNYVGTYYHLAKLYERSGEFEKALQCYKQGITIATQEKDVHSLNELKMALEEIE